MKQRVTWCSLVASLLLVLARVTSGNAQEAVTVRGEIVDLACYMAKGSMGPTHKACAQMCARKGVPIGVLTEQGEVYLLLSNDQDADAYEAAKKMAGEKVDITGKKLNKGGLAGIAVDSVKLAANPASQRVASLPFTDER